MKEKFEDVVFKKTTISQGLIIDELRALITKVTGQFREYHQRQRKNIATSVNKLQFLLGSRKGLPPYEWLGLDALDPGLLEDGSRIVEMFRSLSVEMGLVTDDFTLLLSVARTGHRGGIGRHKDTQKPQNQPRVLSVSVGGVSTLTLHGQMGDRREIVQPDGSAMVFNAREIEHEVKPQNDSEKRIVVTLRSWGSSEGSDLINSTKKGQKSSPDTTSEQQKEFSPQRGTENEGKPPSKSVQPQTGTGNSGTRRFVKQKGMGSVSRMETIHEEDGSSPGPDQDQDTGKEGKPPSKSSQPQADSGILGMRKFEKKKGTETGVRLETVQEKDESSPGLDPDQCSQVGHQGGQQDPFCLVDDDSEVNTDDDIEILEVLHTGPGTKDQEFDNLHRFSPLLGLCI